MKSKPKKQSEWINGMEVIEMAMAAKGWTREEAIEKAFEAILSGELPAHFERPN